LLHLIGTITNRDVVSALGILENLYNDGRDMASLLNEMTSLIRDLLVFRLSPDSGLLLGSGFSHDNLSMLSANLTSARLFFCLDVLKTAISGLQRSGSSKLAVEMCLMKMCDEQLSDNTEALLSRISKLETGGRASVDTSASCDVVAAKPADAMSTEIAKPEVHLDAQLQHETEVHQEPELSPEQDALPEQEAHSPSAPISADSEGFWAETLNLLSKEPSVHALLSDSSKVQAQLQENLLKISVTDSFTANLIESEFSKFLKDAASKALGRDAIIKVEVVDTIDNIDKSGKLESLNALINSI